METCETVLADKSDRNHADGKLFKLLVAACFILYTAMMSVKNVFDASFAATLPNYPPKTDKPAKLVPIYYMDTLAGVNFVPEEFVDITDEIDLKIKMLNCHESQIVWMRDHDHIDFPDMVRTCSRYRGYQCGAEYAEGFKLCKAYLKGTTKRLLP